MPHKLVITSLKTGTVVSTWQYLGSYKKTGCAHFEEQGNTLVLFLWPVKSESKKLSPEASYFCKCSCWRSAINFSYFPVPWVLVHIPSHCFAHSYLSFCKSIFIDISTILTLPSFTQETQLFKSFIVNTGFTQAQFPSVILMLNT